ncbi:MAG: ADP-ribosylglycohydrolase family protein [Caldilineaceae bacterium]|jgi:ADP-ribosyl-[dinitrogen reductase] hydrolase|nr:ADP-ribosylglycohydrolase family protein [Caldilineaceae bacterium]
MSHDRARGALLGLAAGDAVGATVEFKPRGSFAPLTDMVGGGPFHLQPGQWTDDASMALCLGYSLDECNGFDAHDQMTRYVRWWREGYLSSTGACFDIGVTVSKALQKFQRSGDPFAGSTDPHTAGNGCIMRLAPIPLFYFPDIDAAAKYAAESARTTHGAVECLDASRLLARILVRALQGARKEEVLYGDATTFTGAPKIEAIARGDYREKVASHIRGSGYVVDCLEAALWCVERTGNFADAVLLAANLGDDADTTAAVCGQVAGAYYGESGIPVSWRETLVMRQEIGALAEQLFTAGVG